MLDLGCIGASLYTLWIYLSSFSALLFPLCCLLLMTMSVCVCACALALPLTLVSATTGEMAGWRPRRKSREAERSEGGEGAEGEGGEGRQRDERRGTEEREDCAFCSLVPSSIRGQRSSHFFFCFGRLNDHAGVDRPFLGAVAVAVVMSTCLLASAYMPACITPSIAMYPCYARSPLCSSVSHNTRH